MPRGGAGPEPADAFDLHAALDGPPSAADGHRCGHGPACVSRRPEVLPLTGSATAPPPAPPGGLPPVPPLGGVLETALYAPDLAAAAAFYGGVLGLAEIGRVEGRHVFYRCGAGVLLVFRAEATGMPPRPDARLPVPAHGARGSGHMAFGVPAAALDAWVARLRAAGIAIEADFTWPGGGRSVYVGDPAGNSIEFADPAIWEPAG